MTEGLQSIQTVNKGRPVNTFCDIVYVRPSLTITIQPAAWWKPTTAGLSFEECGMSRAAISVRALAAARTIADNAKPGRVVSSENLLLVARVSGDQSGAEILGKQKTGFVIENEAQAQTIQKYMKLFIQQLTQELR